MHDDTCISNRGGIPLLPVFVVCSMLYIFTDLDDRIQDGTAVLIEKHDVLRVRYTMRAFAHICLQSVLVAEHVVPLRVSAMTHM